jgi:hypothetical protein
MSKKRALNKGLPFSGKLFWLQIEHSMNSATDGIEKENFKEISLDPFANKPSHP